MRRSGKPLFSVPVLVLHLVSAHIGAEAPAWGFAAAEPAWIRERPGSGAPAAAPASTRLPHSWRRFVLFRTADPSERLFHVRVLPAGDVAGGELHVLCMGLVPPADAGGDFTTVLYERVPGGVPRALDRFPAAVRTAPAVYGVAAEDGIWFDPYVWRQSDNLIPAHGFLYYYKEPAGAEDGEAFWRHWKYRLGSGEAPLRATEAEFLEAARSYNIEDFQHVSLSPDGRTVAYSDTYGLRVFRDPGDFRLLRAVRAGPEAFRPMPGDFAVEGPLLIGALCWSGDGRFLYFDNSGVDYRCLWALEVEGRSVLKIVPEHGAMHPWWFSWNGASCVAYVESGSVRVAVERPERVSP